MAKLVLKFDLNEEVEISMEDQHGFETLKKIKKAIIELDPDDYDDKALLLDYLKSSDKGIAIFDIAQDIFRPHRKHGYNSQKLNTLIGNCGEYKDADGFDISNGEELIGELEDMFYEVLEKYEVSEAA
jgi:hypothetical protein